MAPERTRSEPRAATGHEKGVRDNSPPQVSLLGSTVEGLLAWHAETGTEEVKWVSLNLLPRVFESVVGGLAFRLLDVRQMFASAGNLYSLRDRQCR